MEVTEEIFTKLKDLQEVLVEKYQIEAKKSEAPKQLSSQEELLAVLKKEYIAKNNENAHFSLSELKPNGRISHAPGFNKFVPFSFLIKNCIPFLNRLWNAIYLSLFAPK